MLQKRIKSLVLWRRKSLVLSRYCMEGTKLFQIWVLIFSSLCFPCRLSHMHPHALTACRVFWSSIFLLYLGQISHMWYWYILWIYSRDGLRSWAYPQRWLVTGPMFIWFFNNNHSWLSCSFCFLLKILMFCLIVLR